MGKHGVIRVVGHEEEADREDGNGGVVSGETGHHFLFVVRIELLITLQMTHLYPKVLHQLSSSIVVHF